jgi:hypothetical protein
MADHQARSLKATLVPVALLLLAGFMLAACVEAKTPLLAGTKPMFGEQFQLNLYQDFTDGKATAVKTAVFRWNATRYARVSGEMSGVKYVVVQSLDDTNLLIETTDEKDYVYLLGRKLAEGTYRILPVDENYVDAAAQKQLCVTQDRQTCTVATRAQLDAFVNAALGKTIAYTMLAVISVPTN